jgi:hypothetical protein
MAAASPLRGLSDFLYHTAAVRALPVLRGFAHAAIDTVFPPACLNCRESTGASGSLCATCWEQVRFSFCDRLGTPLAMDLGNDGLLSPEAVADPPVYARARAVAHFEDGPVRRLVHQLKYRDRMELAKPLGAWMARAGNEILAEAEVLIPAPCTAAALPSADSIRRTPWQRPSLLNAASRPILLFSRESSRRHRKLASRVRNGRLTYKARSA